MKKQQKIINNAQQPKYYAYQHNPEIQVKQKERSLAAAFNKDNSLLAISAMSKIKLIQLKNGSIKYIQSFCGNSSYISTITFMKNKTFIISSQDCSIFIWTLNLMNNPKFIFKLKDHKSWINCIILHPLQEDLIISGSKDTTLKFWSLSTPSLPFNWFLKQTITQHKYEIYGLSLNQEGNKLISCQGHGLIFIMQGSNKSFWKVIQTIGTNSYGYRINFITNNIFVFQPCMSNSLQIFIKNVNTGNYQHARYLRYKKSQYNCQTSFPARYLPDRQLLLIKHGDTLNLIKFIFFESQLYQQDCNCILEQCLEFNSNEFNGGLYGGLSENGDILVTWDSKSQEIQIRQFKEM
ncbi:unnamed protein product [Paramecium pentaurelia]|uniref:Uncharacterized protein n=1 Tax=Paramecium pentaurelia TaxID=43138 RepID=A0A8S1XYH5_9CILI|nr:unnamed protein product [Paramecium pentaurelia]